MGEMGFRLVHRREELGLSVSETAREAGISRAYLQRLEHSDRDINVSAAVLRRLSEVLRTDPEVLLGKAEPRSDVATGALADYLHDVEMEARHVTLFLDLARAAEREMSRDDWLVIHRALMGTLLKEPPRRPKATVG